MADEKYYAVAKPKASDVPDQSEDEKFARKSIKGSGGQLVDHDFGDEVIVVEFDDQSEAVAWSSQEGVMGTLFDNLGEALYAARSAQEED